MTDDLDTLLEALPSHLTHVIKDKRNISDLLEIVLDLGRLPEARYRNEEIVLSKSEVSQSDLDYVVSRVGAFGGDNRAGIPRTLHRISAIRNRSGNIVGLTCRVGRAVHGTISIIKDLVESDQSILLLGRPGVGKTTMLREVARVIADEMHKRVVIVDTSNEIAGDGDIPHPGIGHSRRMQVPSPSLQHAVMIEAVENHMPEVIIIDEIGTELEAAASRTIAERGVQLVATAHGNALNNLVMNPTLSDLIGGIQSVTLGDEEARRRGTQKSILERKAPPTFNVVVEIQSFDRVAVHPNVSDTVDALLRGDLAMPEVRWLDENGKVHVEKQAQSSEPATPLPGGWARQGIIPSQQPHVSQSHSQQHSQHQQQHQERRHAAAAPGKSKRVYAFGLTKSKLEQIVRSNNLPLEIVNDIRNADVLLTTKAYYRNKPQIVRNSETSSVPIVVLRKNSPTQIEQAIMNIAGIIKERRSSSNPMDVAMQEAEHAADKVKSGEQELIELTPQSSYIRRLQHQIAEKYNLQSQSTGREPFRHVTLQKESRGGNGSSGSESNQD
ncbi:MAG: AAA family ATPase [Dehalococcoidia bacterium]|nr:AAA family ATPase [Dehalococcoidia bacterium]